MIGMFAGRSPRRYLLALVIVAFSSGCVYYNTFFLARKKFEQAEKSQMESADKRSEQGPGRPGQPGGPRGRTAPPEQGGERSGQIIRNVSPQEKNLYDDAIKKASKVLKFHPDSKWVDDALWLIGKSYYNMGEYLQADRKFKELVTNHPKSKFADDAYFYMGLSQIELGHRDLAQEVFDRLKATFKKSEYLDDVSFVGGKLARDDEEYQEAVDLFNEYLQKYPKGDSAAQAEFYAGQCIELMGDNYRAYASYIEVEKYKPSRQLRFDAALAAASAILKTDSIGAGMKILDDLARDESYFEYSSKIRLKIAEGYLLQGRTDEALAKYTEITEQSPKSLEAAEAYYRLGLIFQTDLFDLEKAKEAFLKAQSENSASEFRNLALARSAQIAKLETYQLQLQKADSVMIAGQSGGAITETAMDSTDTLKTVELEKPADVIQPADSTELPSSRVEGEFADSSLASPEAAADEGAMAEGNIDTTSSPVDSTEQVENAEAAHQEDWISDRSDTSYTVPLENLNPLVYGPEEIVTNDPGADTGSVMPTGNPEMAADHAEGDGKVDSPGANDAARQDSIRQEIIKTGIETRFLLAELYAYDLNRPDSAVREFLQIADQFSGSEYAPRSLLACASLEFRRGDSVSAEEYLRRLLREHPRSSQAALAAQQLGFQVDLSNNAQGLYARAESLALEAGNLDSAIAIFKQIADDFPDLGPKASFAIARALDKAQVDEDSSAYHAYNHVCERYPQSVYAAAARERMGQTTSRSTPKRTGRQEEVQQAGKTEPDLDSLRQLAFGLPSAPPVRKQGEFVYPERLLDRQLKGQVLFKVRLNMFGKVEEYEIIGPSGEYAIDSAATEALLKTEFETSNIDLSQLDSFYKYGISFERPDINIFNDPYLEERRDPY